MADNIEMKKLISLYIDGETTPEETKLVQDAISKDPELKSYFNQLSKLSQSLTLWQDESLSPDLENKIRTEYKEAEMNKKKEFKQTKKPAPTSVFARQAVLMIALVVILAGVTQYTMKKSVNMGIRKAADTIEKQYNIPAGLTKKIKTHGATYKASSLSAPARQDEVKDYEPYYVDVNYEINSTEGRTLSAEMIAAPAEGISTRMVAPDISYSPEPFNTEDYDRIYENEFVKVTDNPLSTFSIDVDTASYSNVRRYLDMNQMPPEDSVRIEELVNYFSYDYPAPEGNEPFSITTEAAKCPWNEDHTLALIGLQGKVPSDLPPSNLVFLIDVSGSMNSAKKLPLLKTAYRMMVNQLSDNERVAIVVYAGAAGKVLDSTPGSNKQKILAAIDNLRAGGSTAGGAGIKLAYSIAKENFIDGGNNRVILATDGDFNIGASSDAELTRLIEKKRDEGIFLTVLGFGTGNYKDNKMEKIADKGNGNYYYIDTEREAKKVLVSELGSTLFTIAKDVKIQVEFNPSKVKAYKLIGYENRMLAKEDFNDDTKDAGELGAGHRVTALYEIVPAGSDEEFGNVDDLVYQKQDVVKSDDLMTVKLRYKEPEGTTSKLIKKTIKTTEVLEAPKGDFEFASAVAEFGLLLRNSKFKANASYQDVIKEAKESAGKDKFGYRAEFISLVEKASKIDYRPENGGKIQFK